MRDLDRGVLITFEGGEASGKSTQIEHLATWLEGFGYDVVTAREPGTTIVGEAVRSVVLDADEEIDPWAELALYVAARAQLTAQTIRPALEVGKVVLLDRYGDSSVAYQGCGRGLGADRVATLNAWVTGGLVPDLTILIDMPVAESARRQAGKRRDRLERAGEAFHDRVRAGYEELAMNEPARFFVVDGRKPIDDIERVIRDRVEALLGNRSLKRAEVE